MMGAFLYGTALQWRLDIRSRTLLITCYVVPLLFFAMMGGIFTSVNPSARETLVPSMTVMGVSMGALIGLPPSLVEIYGGDIKKMYKANGVPLYFGLIPALRRLHSARRRLPTRQRISVPWRFLLPRR